ncbi:MAG TPA: hypothetical protein VFP25_01885 [Nitrososphaeraceae archaeon]|nr:hypothetical protein [Nitrososphaeraceae archaeon]
MVKCSYCKESVSTYDKFSGIPNQKFCLRCWYKIYNIWQAQQHLIVEPQIMEYVKQIKDVTNETKEYYEKIKRDDE